MGRVPGHRLRFNLEGKPKGKAAPANISADNNAEVWGVLYRITRHDMVWLNSTEDIPGWRYRPIWLDGGDKQGNPLSVFIIDHKIWKLLTVDQLTKGEWLVKCYFSINLNLATAVWLFSP